MDSCCCTSSTPRRGMAICGRSLTAQAGLAMRASHAQLSYKRYAVIAKALPNEGKRGSRWGLTLGIPDLQGLAAKAVQDTQEARLKGVPEHAAACCPGAQSWQSSGPTRWPLLSTSRGVRVAARQASFLPLHTSISALLICYILTNMINRRENCPPPVHANGVPVPSRGTLRCPSKTSPTPHLGPI